MRIQKIVIALCIVLAGCNSSSVDAVAPVTLAGILDQTRATSGIVGMAGGLVSNGAVQVYVSGLRKVGSGSTVTASDKFQIGSLTKAMTATVAGTLVRDHILGWDTTLAQVFPELALSIPEPFRRVTLRQLLMNRAGITTFPSTFEEAAALPTFAGAISEQRLQFVAWAVGESDTAEIDSLQYSNSGYVIAAAMCERVSGRSWEELMNERLLVPLGISADFAWPAEGYREQPWGHSKTGYSTYIPFDPDGDVQFPDILSPAGQLSMSAGDYMKFIQLHIAALQGKSPLLPREIAETLHAPNGTYAMGWVVAKDAQTGSTLSFHDGDDGTFESFVVMNRNEGRASFVFINCSGPGINVALAQACVDILHDIR
jgi:D-alanyl-D-alanine carboxypeptidase